jgi:hypothetical protein
MPLTKDEEKGTNKDGSLSEEYCVYCFKGGEFTKPEQTLEEAIAESEEYADMAGMTKAEARAYAEKVLPTLGRWKK